MYPHPIDKWQAVKLCSAPGRRSFALQMLRVPQMKLIKLALLCLLRIFPLESTNLLISTAHETRTETGPGAKRLDAEGASERSMPEQDQRRSVIG